MLHNVNMSRKNTFEKEAAPLELDPRIARNVGRVVEVFLL
jgi:hypothetical protein